MKATIQIKLTELKELLIAGKYLSAAQLIVFIHNIYDDAITEMALEVYNNYWKSKLRELITSLNGNEWEDSHKIYNNIKHYCIDKKIKEQADYLMSVL